ncbi:hypothetical protein QJQ45_020316 [Haematococcus lacustris]|nr:hypothetical protein QJQ45_020316 [Haematococcus lacustris]
MAPPSKGKKNWRRNLDDAEVIDHVEKESHQERRGPAVETLQDSQLFFVDKAATPGAQLAQAVKQKRRVPRPTRAQLILSAPQQLKPVMQYRGPAKQDKGAVNPRLARKEAERHQARAAAAAAAAAASKALAAEQAGHLWRGPSPSGPAPTTSPAAAAPQPEANGGGGPVQGEVGAVEGSKGPGPSPAASSLPTVLRTFLEGDGEDGAQVKCGKAQRGRLPGTRGAAPQIKAVEVDMAGCSYNPPHEAHQDALAVLVASEMKKQLRKELGPAPVPLLVPSLDTEQDELARLQTEALEDDNEIRVDEEGSLHEPGSSLAAPHGTRKKTRKDRNREARLQQRTQEAAARSALKRQRQQLQSLPDLAAEVEAEEGLRAAKIARRKVVKEEKAASQPPKLGKLRFEDLAVQVLTSDELGGGLRRLKPCPMLATERFKSLQKRGLIEPRKPVGTKGTGRRVLFKSGDRTEKAVEGQLALDKLKASNRVAKKR